MNTIQWRSQNVKKTTSKGVTGSNSDFFSIVSLFKIRTSLKEKNMLQGSELFPLRAVPYGMEITFATLGDLP